MLPALPKWLCWLAALALCRFLLSAPAQAGAERGNRLSPSGLPTLPAPPLGMVQSSSACFSTPPWLWAQGQALHLCPPSSLKEPPADLGLTLKLLDPAGLKNGRKVDRRWCSSWASCLPWVWSLLLVPAGSQCQPSFPEPLNLAWLRPRSAPPQLALHTPLPPKLFARLVSPATKPSGPLSTVVPRKGHAALAGFEGPWLSCLANGDAGACPTFFAGKLGGSVG